MRREHADHLAALADVGYSTPMSSFSHRVGRMSIARVPELDLNDFALTKLLPELDPKEIEDHPEWLDPRTYDATTGKALLSVHSWVIRDEDRTILIDTCAGNDKARPTMKMLDHLHQPWLARLASVGVQPEEVDFVLLTHIHADHVGWNTSWRDDKWVPTFPNATVICSALEWRYGAALAAEDDEETKAVLALAGLGEPTRKPVGGVFADSMKPVHAAGLLRTIEVDGAEVLPGIRFLPAPGHSIDHAAIAIASEGEQAIFGGDVVHHPLEMQKLELVSMFCEFPEAARRSRRDLLEKVAATKSLYFSSHFPGSSFGRVVRDGKSYRRQFHDAAEI